MTISASAREFSRYLDAIVDLTRQYDSQELLTGPSHYTARFIAASGLRGG